MVVGAAGARARRLFSFPPAKPERNEEWWGKCGGVKTGGGEGIVLCCLQMEMGSLASNSGVLCCWLLLLLSSWSREPSR